MKPKNDMEMANITMAFETNSAMNHLNKCKASDWPQGLALQLLEESNHQV